MWKSIDRIVCGSDEISSRVRYSGRFMSTRKGDRSGEFGESEGK